MLQCARGLPNLSQTYWIATQFRGTNKTHKGEQTCWKPPYIGEVIFKFHVIFQNSNAFLGVVQRDHPGKVMGAWTNKYYALNAFCAQLLAAIFALELGDKLTTGKSSFKGDSISIILAIKEFKGFKIQALESGK